MHDIELGLHLPVQLSLSLLRTTLLFVMVQNLHRLSSICT